MCGLVGTLILRPEATSTNSVWTGTAHSAYTRSMLRLNRYPGMELALISDHRLRIWSHFVRRCAGWLDTSHNCAPKESSCVIWILAAGSESDIPLNKYLRANLMQRWFQASL